MVASLRRRVVRARRRPEKMGKPPKQRKTWKNAYLALRPEEGPTPEEIAAREAKIKAREEKMAQWELENKAGKMSIKGAGRGGETIVSPVTGKEDKGAAEFYKTVRSKPKGKTRKGAERHPRRRRLNRSPPHRAALVIHRHCDHRTLRVSRLNERMRFRERARPLTRRDAPSCPSCVAPPPSTASTPCARALT